MMLGCIMGHGECSYGHVYACMYGHIYAWPWIHAWPWMHIHYRSVYLKHCVHEVCFQPLQWVCPRARLHGWIFKLHPTILQFIELYEVWAGKKGCDYKQTMGPSTLRPKNVCGVRASTLLTLELKSKSWETIPILAKIIYIQWPFLRFMRCGMEYFMLSKPCDKVWMGLPKYMSHFSFLFWNGGCPHIGFRMSCLLTINARSD